MRGGEVDAGASDDDMGVEDSLRGPQRSMQPRFGRAHAPITHSVPDLPNTPSSAGLLDAYAYAATPDAALPSHPRSMLAEPPRIQRPAQQAPTRGAATLSQTSAFPPGPARASSGLFAAPAPRPVPHGNLFARPPQAFGASLGHFDLDNSASASISISGSFSFGPAAARVRPEGMPSIRPGPMLFNVGRAAAAVQTRQTSDAAFFAAPQTPVRPGRATTAVAAATAMAQPPSPANLETAALAAERRTREQRSARPDPSAAASTAAAAGDVPNRRVVSFSTTPAEAAMTPANMLAAPSRAGVAGAVAARAGANTRMLVPESSFSHLGRAPSRPMLLPGAAAGQRDVSMSLSDVSASVHGAATRLFARAAPLPSASSGVFGSESIRDPHQSWSQHPSSSLSGPAPEPVEQVRLRRWDGAQTSVPAYLVADNAESAVEEQFDYDTIARFDVRQLVARHDADVAGEGKPPTQQADTDALQAILDIQLGLRGLHGWFGHTYRNPRRDAVASAGGVESGRTSRKRRRRDSGASDASSASNASRQSGSDAESDEDAPIVVYDTFGRVRGSVTLPNYTHRGGRGLPLPPPHETQAVRSASAAHTVRTRGAALGEKEAALVHQCELVRERYAQLQPDAHQTVRSAAFYKQMAARRAALVEFRKRLRPALMVGLQNAYLDSAVAGYRR